VQALEWLEVDALSTLVFEIAGRYYGFDAADVREIVFLPALTRLPGQPAVLDGFVNLRGRAVPVVSLGRLFGLDARAPGLHTPLVVGEALALAVDRVEEVASVEAWRPIANGHSFNDCAVADFDFAGRGATLLDVRRILLEKERQCVAELRERAQAQLDSLRTPAP
jgi:purine-binding chemotaxis protein CheW